MSCRSSLSFIALSLTGALDYRDDSRHCLRRVTPAGHDGDAGLARLRGLERVELAVEQARGEEVTVPGGQPPGRLLPVHAQEDHPRLRPPAEQRVAVGALERRAGHHGRLAPRDALV